MKTKHSSQMTRRDFLRISSSVALGTMLASCGPAATQSPSGATQPPAAATQPPAAATQPPAAATQPPAGATQTPASPQATNAPAGFSEDAALKATSYQDWMSLGVRSQDKITLQAVTYLVPDQAADGTHFDDKTYIDYTTGEWKKLYPNGDFSHESVSWNDITTKEIAYAQSNTAMDIGGNYHGDVAGLMNIGAMQPLDPYMSQWWWNTRIKGQITPPHPATFSGKLIMASQVAEMTATMGRKDVLAKAGIDDPNTIKTWQDWLNALKAVSEKTEYKKPLIYFMGVALSANDVTKNSFLGNGLKGCCDFSNKDAYNDAVTYTQELFQYVPDSALNWDWGDGEQAYWSGVGVWLMVHGDWLMGSRSKDTVNAFPNTVVLPRFFGPNLPKQQPFYALNSTGFMVFAKSKNPQAAADWIACATTKTAELANGADSFPSSNDWTVDDVVKALRSGESIRPWFNTWLDLIKRSDVQVIIDPGLAISANEIHDHQYQLLTSLYRGEIKPTDFYPKMKAFAEPLLAKFQTPVP